MKEFLKEKIEVVLRNGDRERDQEREESEISLREILQSVWKGKKIIAITTAVALVTGLVGASLTNPNRHYNAAAESIIAFNYEGIEKGLDPHGQKFDIGKLKSPGILDKIVQKTKKVEPDITVDDIRNNIEITPIVPGEVTQRIKAQIESVEKGKENVKSLEEYVYFPNQFVIRYNMPDSLDLPGSKSREILDGVIDEYIQYFNDTYTDRSTLANALGNFNYNEYDYPEVANVMRGQINVMKSYIDARNREAGDYRSQATGLTFSDLRGQLDVVDSIDVNRLNSLVTAYKLTKDKDRLVKSLQERIKNYQLTVAKKRDESAKASDIVSKFQKDKNVIVAGNGTAESMVETEKTNPLYDSLVQRSLDTSVDATDALHEIGYLNQQIALYQAEDGTPVEQKKKAEQDAAVLIKRLDEKMKNMIELTNKTVAEYYENKYDKNAVTRVTPAASVNLSNDKLGLILAVSVVLGLMVGIFIALFREYWRKGRKLEEEQEAAENENQVSM